VSCVSLSYVYSSIELLKATRSRHRWSWVQCRIATNKSSVLSLKALSFRFMIFRGLQQLISIYILYQMTPLATCYYWLQRLYLCLLFLEKEYSVTFVWFSKDHRLWASVFIASQTTHLSIDIFLWRLLWILEKKLMNPLFEKGLRIVSKWIPLDSLAYVQGSWRWLDLFERKESWSLQDVTLRKTK